MKSRSSSLFLTALVAFSGSALALAAGEFQLQENFEKPQVLKKWHATDDANWSVDDQEGNHVLHLHGKSNYNPPFRSPHSVILLKDTVLGDVTLTARVKTLQTSRGHRDMCIFFGWQDPSHFYYVHLGELVDPNSSQIFIVNEKPRSPITTENAGGIPWQDGQWHQVKLERKAATGEIRVYFDDMEKPVKVAKDTTFAWGAIGLGSFDDLGLWDDVVIQGTTVKGQSVTLPEKNRKGNTVQK